MDPIKGKAYSAAEHPGNSQRVHLLFIIGGEESEAPVVMGGWEISKMIEARWKEIGEA